VRAVGPIQSFGPLGPHDHVCWQISARDEFRARAVEFLSAGLAAGLRVAYAAAEPEAVLRERLAAVDGFADAMARDALRVMPVGVVYGTGVVDADAVLAEYASATDEALADGYRGLRVAVDVSAIVRTGEQREAFARYELLVDRFAARQPFSALCAYEAPLGADVVAEFAATHPAAQPGLTNFHLYSTEDGGLGLAGEIDAAAHAQLDRVLERVRAETDMGTLTLDMSSLRFIDHRALLRLDAYAHEAGVPLVARSAPPIVRRLGHLLPVRHLQFEAGDA
jgi:anti-anti-sigma regulatory factor